MSAARRVGDICEGYGFDVDARGYAATVEPELPLRGGRVTAGVVRVGDTVRRPTGPHSPFVHRLLRLLEQNGLESVPRLRGLDERGREVLSFHEGWVPPNLEWRRWDDAQVVAAARIVRRFHDATAGSALARDAAVVCHGDLSPCNFVFVGGAPRFLIDFDRAHPDSRRSDLAYMAWAWLVGVEDERHSPPLRTRLRQVRLLLDTYGLDERTGFAAAMQAEQHEILEIAGHRGDEHASAWVEREMTFVARHAAAIDEAAAGMR